MKLQDKRPSKRPTCRIDDLQPGDVFTSACRETAPIYLTLTDRRMIRLVARDDIDWELNAPLRLNGAFDDDDELIKLDATLVIEGEL